LRPEILDLLMNNVAGGIPESKKTNVKYLQFEEPAEKQMACLVDNDARNCQRRDHRSRNEKHS